MIIIYKAFDGKEFTDKEDCLKRETYLTNLKKVFDKLVDEDFFKNYKIKPFYHNYEVTCLGSPTKDSWIPRYNGYVLVRGRMGNGDTVISFKLKRNKLLIFMWDTDDSESEGKKYMGSITLDNRKEKLKKLIKNIKS